MFSWCVWVSLWVELIAFIIKSVSCWRVSACREISRLQTWVIVSLHHRCLFQVNGRMLPWRIHPLLAYSGEHRNWGKGNREHSSNRTVSWSINVIVLQSGYWFPLRRHQSDELCLQSPPSAQRYTTSFKQQQQHTAMTRIVIKGCQFKQICTD